MTDKEKLDLVIEYLEVFFCNFVCSDEGGSKAVRDRGDFLLEKLTSEDIAGSSNEP